MVLLLGGLILFSCSREAGPEKLLLIYNQQDREQNKLTIKQFMEAARQLNAELDTSSNVELLLEDTLRNYQAVILLGIQGEKLDYKQQTEFERYIQAGGSVIVVDGDIEPEFQWPWYRRLQASLKTTHEELPAGTQMPSEGREQNKAQVPDPNPSQISITKHSFDGGKVAFASGLNQRSDEEVQELLRFAMSSGSLSYDKVRSKRVPDESRFTQKVLHDDLNEPMELDIMPDGSVVYNERRGDVKLYDAQTNKVKHMGRFDVCTEGNYEDGMLGLALDPQYSSNHRVYIYYSTPCQDSLQRLSRFFLTKDTLVMASEKTILEVPVQRETCCHSGGAIQFGPDGLLYLSTGDNTSSKESDGYSPLDERSGRGPFDAQKSSANTQDLRGKILRIKVNKDGSYQIPDGNLFPKDGSEGRPEIYVMGVRNPFRFAVDQKNGWLYWGEVGPDSGVDSEQGRESHDEWNRARTAGNYGWPYFQGDNIPYPDWDFSTNTPGAFFDPENPVNDSPNNYGRRELPPARGAMIAYPYGESDLWPNLGTGSRSAMGGPVYYSEMYRNSKVKFPSYYDGKYFIYEWARSWIKVVSFDRNGEPEKIEPFLPDMPLSKPIDMEFGPDGTLYILAYGANYFSKNEEACLIRIEYSEENRKPVAQMSADKTAGAAPLEVRFTAAESFDYDKESSLEFYWKFDGNEVQAEGEEAVYTFDTPGVYTVNVLVKDQEGSEASALQEIRVGNAAPEVSMHFSENSSFYYDHTGLPYQIKVQDKEDGSTADGSISSTDIFFNFGYMKQGKDLANLGSQAVVSPHIEGKRLVEGSDCKSCHHLNKTSIGPNYQQIAERYYQQKGAVSMLASKIIKGGNGNWGHSMMAAHPQLSKEEASKMVEYVLSLSKDATGQAKQMPLEGKFALDQHLGKGEEGSYYLSVQYTDRGANDMPALSARETIVLRHPRLQAEDYTAAHKAARQRPRGGDFAFVGGIKHGSYIAFHDLDLNAIQALTFNVKARTAGIIEARIDSPEGTKIAEAEMDGPGDKPDYQQLKAKVQPVSGRHDLFFVFRSSNPEDIDKQILELDWIYFHATEEASLQQ